MVTTSSTTSARGGARAPTRTRTSPPAPARRGGPPPPHLGRSAAATLEAVVDAAGPCALRRQPRADAAWLNPRRRARAGWSGTGTSAGAPARQLRGRVRRDLRGHRVRQRPCPAVLQRPHQLAGGARRRRRARRPPPRPRAPCAAAASAGPRGSARTAARRAAPARSQPQHRGGARTAVRAVKRMPPRLPGGGLPVGTPVRQSSYMLVAAQPQIEWLNDPAVLAPLALLVFVYVRRFRQARREAGGRGAGPLQAAAFAGAILALLAALVSPIDGLGDHYLFSMHMVQHVLLGDIAPLLLLLSLSRVIMRPLTRRLMSVERALGPLAHPRDRPRPLARPDVPLAHPRDVRRRARAPAGARARARELLHRGDRRLVGADPARADAPAADRDVAARLHRRRQVRARGARPLSDLVLERPLPLLRGRAADLGPDRDPGPEHGRRDHDGRAVADVRDRAGVRCSWGC